MATPQGTDDSPQAIVNPGPAAPHRFDVARIGVGSRGPRYRVTCGGIVVAESTTEPALDGARGALGLGITGMAETWHVAAAYASMRFDIATAARLTVADGEKSGPRFATWRPFDRTQHPGMAIADPALGQGREFEGAPLRHSQAVRFAA